MTATYPLMRQATERGNNMLREEAIKKHRAMWNWIAEQIVTNERTMNIAMLKNNYIGMQGDILKLYTCNNCYLCAYTKVNCEECPLLWPSHANNYKCEYGYILSNRDNSTGLYSRCLNLMDSGKWKLQAQLAYEIANLPEREISK